MVYAVQRHAAIIANNAAPAIGVRQTGNNAHLTSQFHLFRIRPEDGCIVRGAVIMINIADFRGQLIAVGFTSLLGHADAAVDDDAALQRSLGLQTDNNFQIFFNVTGAMGCNGRDPRRIDRQNAAFFLFRFQQVHTLVPKLFGPRRRRRQERVISCIRLIVALNEAAHVNAPLPPSALKFVPCFVVHHRHCSSH